MKIINQNRVKGVLLLLPGRGQSGINMREYFKNYDIFFDLISIEPENEWYPMPNGPEDQEEAILGCKESAQRVFKIIRENYKDQWIGVAGFSAGAAVALQLSLITTKLDFVISCSGTLLDTKQEGNFIGNYTKYFLLHGKKDNVFKWNERFLPTQEYFHKNAIRDVVSLTSTDMGHEIHSDFVNSCLGIVSDASRDI